MRQARRKAHKLASRPADNKSFLAGGTRKNSSKLNEQCGDLYENKAPLWKTQGEAGMSMKTKVLSR
jgi:hypothetical protein